MKKTLKLIPAIAMLLIATVLVSTATYAWFSMNTSVSATGMQVKAKSSGSLYISNAANEPDYKDIDADTVAFTDAAAELMPTSTIGLSMTSEGNGWYYVAAAAATGYDKATSSAYTKVAVADLNKYVLKKTVYVRSETSFKDLQVNGVTINVTPGVSGQTILGNALTVAFKVTHYTNLSDVEQTTGCNTPYFVSNEATTNRHGGISSTDASSGAVALTFTPASSIGTGSEQSALTIWTNSASTNDVTNFVFAIDIFIYFDGQSASCYSNALTNAVTLAGDIAVSFTTAPYTT